MSPASTASRAASGILMPATRITVRVGTSIRSVENASHFASQLAATTFFPCETAFVRFLSPPLLHAGRAIHGPCRLLFARPRAALHARAAPLAPVHTHPGPRIPKAHDIFKVVVTGHQGVLSHHLRRVPQPLGHHVGRVFFSPNRPRTTPGDSEGVSAGRVRRVVREPGVN